MKADNFDKMFEEGIDITDSLDLNKAKRPEHEQKRVNVDFPVWMIHSLDKEASKLGIPRQAVIKMVVADHLQHQKSS